MSRPRAYYYKSQTRWVRVPAMVSGHRGESTVALRIDPSRDASERPKPPATIIFEPHEAQAFAAWLSEQADHLLAKQARSAARKAARAAAKESKP